MQQVGWKRGDVKQRYSTPLVLLTTLIALALAACTTLNPATGEHDFTLFLPQSKEAQVGADEHPRILARFGGVFDDPKIGAYVASIGGRLVYNSEQPGLPFRFTVLNTPIVNAFAVPGGYIYVTRGLLALANSEAELAGVLAHEIGHVIARHTAQRYSRATLAQLGKTFLDVVTGSWHISKLAQVGSELYLSSFSREQEFEADLLGVRYLLNTGYDPYAQARFLKHLSFHKNLELKLSGEEGRPPETNLFSTHPRTPERVHRAIAAVGGSENEFPAFRERYLSRIDGMLYGDDSAQGFVRGHRFFHPTMRFKLEAPSDYRLFNMSRQLIAKGPQKSLFILDDPGKTIRQDVYTYLTTIWARDLSLQAVKQININGFQSATGHTTITTQNGAMHLRLIAIQFRPDWILRLSFITPPHLVNSLAESHWRTVHSFQSISEEEASQVPPHRVRIITVGSGDTVEKLGSLMPFADNREERFRALNGLTTLDQLKLGQKIKIIAEG